MQADRPQQPLERVAKRDIVINDQDGGPCVRHRCYSRSKDHGDEPLSVGPRGLTPPLEKSYSIASAPIPQTGDRRLGPKGDALDTTAFNFPERRGGRERPGPWRETAPVSRHQSRSAAISWADRSPPSAGRGIPASGQAAGGDQGA